MNGHVRKQRRFRTGSTSIHVRLVLVLDFIGFSAAADSAGPGPIRDAENLNPVSEGTDGSLFTTLWDQTSNSGPGCSPSQNFLDFGGIAQAADDFTISF